MLVREEFYSVVSKLQIQRMVTHCMLLTSTQKLIGFTFGHRIFVTEKGFSGKYCSLFSHTRTKNSFCCDSCSISQKNQPFPRICHHFSLPSKQLTAVKPNRIRTHSPLKPTTTSSAGQSPLQAFLYNQGLKCNSAVRPRLFYDGSPG